MIQLGRHIEILLLDNDCVIVPDFGGFVAHHVSARYDEDDHSWLPPMRTLGFNAQLRINDSLLAQSYVNAYDISYPEALRRIENEVEELKQLLANEGCYTMDDIGTLTINDEGNYQFEPCEAGILSPAYYGLDACSFVTLKEARGMNVANVALQASTEPVELPQPTSSDSPALLDFADNGEPEEEHVIRIKMSWVRNIAAIAAAVIAFFVMATPIANSDLRTRAMSDLKGNLLYKLIPQDTNIKTGHSHCRVCTATNCRTCQRHRHRQDCRDCQGGREGRLYGSAPGNSDCHRQDLLYRAGQPREKRQCRNVCRKAEEARLQR